MSDLIAQESNAPAKATFRVDAKRVFKEAMDKVDDAIAILEGPARSAAEALPQVDEKEGQNLAVLVNGYVKTTEIRAKLAAEQAKLLVEMQKDLNRCAIERERIASSVQPLDPTKLTDEQLMKMVAASGS
jgi:hypothetical protein